MHWGSIFFRMQCGYQRGNDVKRGFLQQCRMSTPLDSSINRSMAVDDAVDSIIWRPTHQLILCNVSHSVLQCQQLTTPVNPAPDIHIGRKDHLTREPTDSQYITNSSPSHLQKVSMNKQNNCQLHTRGWLGNHYHGNVAVNAAIPVGMGKSSDNVVVRLRKWGARPR